MNEEAGLAPCVADVEARATVERARVGLGERAQHGAVEQLPVERLGWRRRVDLGAQRLRNAIGSHTTSALESTPARLLCAGQHGRDTNNPLTCKRNILRMDMANLTQTIIAL